MEIVKIFSYLVHAAKGEDKQPHIGGTKILLEGNVYRLLKDLFEKSVKECSIEIAFKPPENGEQTNECRDELIALLRSEDIADGRKLAVRLQAVTTNRSGLGLLFLSLARSGDRRKVVVSRFPADNGILAEEDQEELSVKFVEKVFMRNALAYKAVRYTDDSLDAGFWTGFAADRQINNPILGISNYWIREFLLSDFATTSAAGTRRLAGALNEAMHNAPLPVKQEIVAAAQLVNGLEGRTVCITDFMSRFGFSETTKDAILGNLSRQELASDRFPFSVEEFRRHVHYKFVELDNGAMLTAEIDNFGRCFEEEVIEEAEKIYAFRTQGKIVDERLRKTR